MSRMLAERYFQQFDRLIFSQIRILDNSADDEPGCNFGEHRRALFRYYNASQHLFNILQVLN